MSDFVRDFKRFTAKAVFYDIQSLPESRRDWMLYRIEFVGKYDNRVNKYWFWQDKSHPIELTTNEMIEQRMNYIHENPIRAGIVTVAEDYLYSSARNYLNYKNGLDFEKFVVKKSSPKHFKLTTIKNGTITI